MSSASRRSMRTQNAWNVITHIARDVGPTSFASRSRISPAALFVKVIARILCGGTPRSPTRLATRYVRTRVLPEPAPASSRSGPSVVVTASRWEGLRAMRSSVIERSLYRTNRPDGGGRALSHELDHREALFVLREAYVVCHAPLPMHELDVAALLANGELAH